MPKSKRAKVVHLTKVKKKDKGWKDGLISKVRECVEEYPAVYLLRYENMRNDKFKELREDVKEQGKFQMGSNKKLQVALGRTEADEVRDGMHLLSQRIRGFVALFFTSMEREEVMQLFEEFRHEDFARAGAKATEDVAMPAGPLTGPEGPISHTQEPLLRKYGMPTKLNKGVVELLAPYEVCKEGRELTSNQAAILRLFGVKMATFKFEVMGMWRDNEYEVIQEPEMGPEEEDEEAEGSGDEFGGDGLTEDAMLPPGV